MQKKLCKNCTRRPWSGNQNYTRCIFKRADVKPMTLACELFVPVSEARVTKSIPPTGHNPK
jgi:hypothetical protein